MVAIRAHDDKLNNAEESPTGDDYNEIRGHLGPLYDILGLAKEEERDSKIPEMPF